MGFKVWNAGESTKIRLFLAVSEDLKSYKARGEQFEMGAAHALVLYIGVL